MNTFYWANCFSCFINITKGVKFFVTKCSHLLCANCLDKCTKPTCRICKKSCGVCAINGQISPQLKKCFGNIYSEINNLTNLLRFQINWYDKVLSQLNSQIKQHEIDLVKSKQRLQDFATPLKELDSKIPEAQQMIQKLQSAVKTLTDNQETTARLNMSGKLNRSGGMGTPTMFNGGTGMSMGGFNGGMGGSNGGRGIPVGGSNGGRGVPMGCNNGGMGMPLGGSNGGMGMSLGANNGGMSLGGNNRGFGMPIGGSNGAIGGANGNTGISNFSMGGSNGGMRMSMGGSNGGMAMCMGGRNMAIKRQNDGMMNNMGMKNSGGRRSDQRKLF